MLGFGFVKQMVLVTSVVPYLYWPPESHKKISFFLIVLQLSLDPLQHQLTIKGKLIKIGPTEFKILHLFIKNLNKVFSRNQIMDRVWGNKSEIDDRTVDVHIKRIRACLANDGYDKIIRTIRGEGYSVSEKHLS